MDEQERAELLKEHLNSIISEYNLHDLFNKWGFLDGDMLAQEARPVIEQLIKDIVARTPVIEGLKPIALSTGHNPCYIAFKEAGKEDEHGFIRLEEVGDALVKMKIEKVFEPILKTVIAETRQRLGLKE